MAKSSKKSRDEKWQNHLADVRAFAHSHNRWPSTTAEDEVEKKLAQWWSRQKYYNNIFEKKGVAPGMDKERSEAVNHLIESFEHFERDGQWMYRYKKVRNRINNHGRLWPYNTKNKEEERTLRWFNQQKTFCRKFYKGEVVGGMTKKRAEKIAFLQGKLGQPLFRDTSNKFEEVLGFEDPDKTETSEVSDVNDLFADF